MQENHCIVFFPAYCIIIDCYNTCLHLRENYVNFTSALTPLCECVYSIMYVFLMPCIGRILMRNTAASAEN